MNRAALFVICILFSFSTVAHSESPCQSLPGYNLRYTNHDQSNPANNELWLEDHKGFRLVRLEGADCSKIAITGSRIFWIEYPSHDVKGLHLQTRSTERYSTGLEFVVSSDGRRLVVEKDQSLTYIDTQKKNEINFFQLPANLSVGAYRVSMLGFSPDDEAFWFALRDAQDRMLDYRVLTRHGNLILTRHRNDPQQEAVLHMPSGRITQNNGTQLVVFDLLGEKKTLIETFLVGTKVRPRWMGPGHLQYDKEGKTLTIIKKDLDERLSPPSATATTVEKREFVPISW